MTRQIENVLVLRLSICWSVFCGAFCGEIICWLDLRMVRLVIRQFCVPEIGIIYWLVRFAAQMKTN